MSKDFRGAKRLPWRCCWMIPFAAYITAYTSNAFQWAGQPPKIAPSHRDLEPHLIHGSLGTHKSAPKWHLDRLSHYSTSVWPTHRQRDRHTDRQTTLCATSVAINRICDAAYNNTAFNLLSALNSQNTVTCSLQIISIKYVLSYTL